MSNPHDDGKAPRHIRALSPRFRTKGISGTQLNGGVISKESNPQLTGLNWVQEAEDMLRTDPIVRRSWHMLRQTLLSATWRFEPGVEGDIVSEELARYANEAFGFDGNSGQMIMSWEDQLSYLFEFVPVGYRYAEEIYKVGPDSTGKVRVWLSHYADREPSAHSRWLSRDDQNLDGVLQNMVGSGKVPEPIPANKLLLLTLNKTGSNFEGVGMLRPVWWWWRTKQRVSNLMCVGLDRWAVPTPKVVVDRSTAESIGLSDGDIDAMIDDAEAQAQAFISAEQSYLVENAAVKFETYAAQPNLYADGPINIITKCDSQIAAAFLAQFADLGNTETGARSVGEIHLSVFRRAAINLCDLVAAQVSGPDRRGGGTIGRLIRWNYGAVDQSKLPRLVHTGLDTDELAESLQMLPGLVQSGLITPDDELERVIRAKLGAGDLPEDAQRSPMLRVSSQGGSGGVSALAEQLIARRRHGKSN
tara:strand:+ start:3956 stop:5377 length:1422 start_codon:yes stop_codon:yes gene_type:complete